MRITYKKVDQLSRLIAEGQNLNPEDLEVFYHWVQSSYEALDFDPFQQRRFDEYCRSSTDPDFMRVWVGVWLLKLVLKDISSVDTDSQSR